MKSFSRTIVMTTALIAALLLAACAPGAAGPTPTVGPPVETPQMPQSELDAAPPLSDMTLGGMLDSATSAIELAVGSLETLPDTPLAWRAYQADIEPGQTIMHGHEAGFVFIVSGEHELSLTTGAARLVEEQGFFIEGSQGHTHRGAGRYWEVMLAEPAAAAPLGLEGAEVVFESDALEGLPEAPAHLHLLLVELPPEAQTQIFSLPGPLFIYLLEGALEYETAETGVRQLAAGDQLTLAAGVPVQQRNPAQQPAQFLAFFIVNPEQPPGTPAEPPPLE